VSITDADAIEQVLTALAEAVKSRLDELDAKVAALEEKMREPRQSLARKIKERL
jgi:hypothetical protein